MTTPPVLLRREGPVAILSLNRPSKGNTIDMAMTDALAECVSSVATDDTVRCVILAGSGSLFCGGGDIDAMAAANNAPLYLRQLADCLHKSIRSLMHLGKPMIVLVNGPAAGAGLSLAITGDIVVAARSAHFIPGYSSIGLSPDGGMTWLLPRLIGLRRAQDWLLSNRRVDAEEAVAMGLITSVVDDDTLYCEGLALAQTIAAGSTAALGATCNLLRESLEANLQDHLEREAGELAASAALPDFREGIRTFLDRRERRSGDADAAKNPILAPRGWSEHRGQKK